jgi:hypothetical protein
MPARMITVQLDCILLVLRRREVWERWVRLSDLRYQTLRETELSCRPHPFVVQAQLCGTFQTDSATVFAHAYGVSASAAVSLS